MGKGTEFSVVLPINESKISAVGNGISDKLISQELNSIAPLPTNITVMNSKSENESSSMPTVLVIDDNIEMLNYIASNLTNDSHVIRAHDG